MRTALAFAALLLPLAASAQVTLTSDVSSGTTPQIYIGRANCKTQLINFSWDVGSGNPTAAEEVDIIHARSTGTCAATSASNVSAPDTDTVAPSQAETGTDQVKASAMILDPGDGGFLGGCDNTDHKSSNPYTTYYCIELRPTNGATPVFASLPVNFATANPTPPAGVVITPGDQHFKVNWSAGDPADTIATYDVHVLAADAGLDLTKYAQRVSATTNADVQKTDDGTQLQDNVPYTVEVVANDSYGNTSDPSAPVTGTPIHILDFYSLYRDDGGSAGGGGGCSSTGAATSIAALVLAVGLLARRRRLLAASKKPGGAALLIAFALVAPAARAEWLAPERSPRKLLVAFKIDRYDPRVDSEPAFAGLAPSSRPYFQIFRGRAPLRYQLEVDWEVAIGFAAWSVMRPTRP